MRIGIISLLVLTAIWDIYTTFINKNLLILETNPLIPFGWQIMLAYKVAVIIGLCWLSWYFVDRCGANLQFVFVSLFVVIILAQTFAGLNNQYVKHHIIEDQELKGENYTTFNDIPEEVVLEYQLTKKGADNYYTLIVLVLVLVPMIVSFGSFLVWRYGYAGWL